MSVRVYAGEVVKIGVHYALAGPKALRLQGGFWIDKILENANNINIESVVGITIVGGSIISYRGL